MPSIDHSNIPRFLDNVPISDISTGDRAAMQLGEMYKNLAGHMEAVRMRMVMNPGTDEVPTAHADLEFRVPMFIKDRAFSAGDLDLFYYTPMQSLLTKLAEGQHIIRKILELIPGND